MRPARAPLAAIVLVGSTIACQQRPAPVAQAYLFEKGPYQAIYAPDGYILRLLYDADGNGVADVVSTYGPRGLLLQVEEDVDRDGAVDRWAFYERGTVRRAATARRTPGRSDLWEHFDRAGRAARREFDEDGDGRVDRTEIFETGILARVEADTDRDGRVDRWQEWRAGQLRSEALDTDADGTPDRRVRYDGGGGVASVERLSMRTPR